MSFTLSDANTYAIISKTNREASERLETERFRHHHSEVLTVIADKIRSDIYEELELAKWPSSGSIEYEVLSVLASLLRNDGFHVDIVPQGVLRPPGPHRKGKDFCLHISGWDS